MSQPFAQLGPYRLGRKLGQGGMGAVYEAIETATGRVVAVKVLAPALAAEEGFRGRFEAEIESLKKLRHPHVVRLFGYGDEQGSMFYAMELVDGTSLEEEIRHGRRFEWREVTQIAIKMCKALKHAHDHGIIHRDIKPANILMARDGEVKLSDFGIARLFGNSGMTSDGGVLGTAEYMAPEQADGRPVNERCDQYSLGGVMYALLAGRPPFRATSFVEMLQLQRFSQPQPVRRYSPETPAELERIITQLLEKEPAKRFVNTLMLARSLEAMERGLSVSSARNDFVVTDPQRTIQSQLTGLDPYAATQVPGEPPGPDDASSIAERTPNPQIRSDDPPVAIAPSSRPQPASHFTKVEEQGEDVTAWYAELARVMLTLQSLALVTALVAVLGGAWYLLRPATADQLYRQVSGEVGDGEMNDLRKAEPRIDEFLTRFPEDPRAVELKEYKQQVLLARRARVAKLTARALNDPSLQSPIERCYVEAGSLATANPEAAIVKLQSLVDLYGDLAESDTQGAEFVEVARQDLVRLNEQLAASSAAQLRLLKSRVEYAQAIAQEDPAAARRLWQGIVELYADKPWGAEVVETARQALAEKAAQP